MRTRTRESWGAGPNGRAQVVKGVPGSGDRGDLPFADLLGITLHHAGSDAALSKLRDDAMAAQLREWQRQHRAKADKWADIGYNFVVDYTGVLWTGCGWVRGAHAGSGEGNRRTAGLLIVKGTNEPMSDAQVKTVREFRQSLLERNDEATRVFPHKHWTNTECPGERVIDRIPDILKTDTARFKARQYVIDLPGNGELVAVAYRQPKRGPIARELREGFRFGGQPKKGTNYIETSRGLYVHRSYAKAA